MNRKSRHLKQKRILNINSFLYIYNNVIKIHFNEIIMYKRKLISVFILIFLFFSGQNLFSQETCKVLKEALAGTYEGKCKKGFAHGKGKAVGTDSYEGTFFKGLPHGKGTYRWANGDVYTGEWKRGNREGTGVFNSKTDVMDGLWENDKYMGPKPKAPKVTNVRNIDRYTIKKYGDEKTRVLISFIQNGVRNPNVTGLLMTSSGGSETSMGYLVGYENIEFPIQIKLSYKTKNKLLTAEYDVMFEFEIFEPGDWRVVISN